MRMSYRQRLSSSLRRNFVCAGLGTLRTTAGPRSGSRASKLEAADHTTRQLNQVSSRCGAFMALEPVLDAVDWRGPEPDAIYARVTATLEGIAAQMYHLRDEVRDATAACRGVSESGAHLRIVAGPRSFILAIASCD